MSDMAIAIEDFMKTATAEQKDLLLKLGEAAKQEKKYVDKIKGIYDSIKSGVHSSDGCITLCEDEDDAMVISMRPRQELKRVREQVGTYMEKAVELGMGHLGIIQRNYEQYVGESLQKE